MILRTLFFGLCPLVIGAYLIPLSRYLAAHPVEGYVVHPDGVPVVALCGVQAILLAIASLLLVNMGVWDSWLSIRPLQWFLALSGVLAVEIVTTYTVIVSMNVHMANSTRWTMAAAAVVLPAFLVAAWALDSRYLFLAAVLCAFAGFVGTSSAEKRTEDEGLRQRLSSEHNRIMSEIDNQSDAERLIPYTKEAFDSEIRAKASARIESLPDMSEQLTRLFDGKHSAGDESRIALLFLSERLERLPPDTQEKCWAEADAIARDMLKDVKVYGTTAGQLAIVYVQALKLLCAHSSAQRKRHRSELLTAQESLHGPFG